LQWPVPPPLLALALLSVTAVSACAQGAGEGAPADGFSHRGVVTHVVDGDTLDVRLASGATERIRLLGVDAPERGRCFTARATARSRQLALAKAVELRGDETQARRDRYGRLLAYVRLPGGRDLGYELLAGGHARVFVYRNGFERLASYRDAEASAKDSRAGQWRACGARLRR
jgi:micrococcal nuclease